MSFKKIWFSFLTSKAILTAGFFILWLISCYLVIEYANNHALPVYNESSAVCVTPNESALT